jgi:hypothetical protein
VRIELSKILEQDIRLLFPFAKDCFEEISAILEVPIERAFGDAELFGEGFNAYAVGTFVKEGEAGSLQPVILRETRRFVHTEAYGTTR